MRIVCIGGGPAGLYFGLLMKTLHPVHDIEVVERNRPYDTFGWGVVFSDATMEAMKIWDPQTAAEIQSAFNHWDDIELLFKGRRIRTTGHGFVGIGRKKLLNILQARCEALGVKLTFEREVTSDLEFPRRRPHHRFRRRFFAGARSVQGGVRARLRRAPEPLHLARHVKKHSTPSPSTSARPNTAGSRRISTSSTTRPRPSSSRRPNRPTRRMASTSSARTLRSASARTCSAKCSTAPG